MPINAQGECRDELALDVASVLRPDYGRAHRPLSGDQHRSRPGAARIRDNWALLYAQGIAEKAGAPLAVVFCLVPDFLNATLRQYGFMLDGLRKLEQELAARNIPFFLLAGLPDHEIPGFVNQHHVKALVTDFDPLKLKRQWKNDIAKLITIPFYEVDTHNIVPCAIASPKMEYGAYTIRRKIGKLLPVFLDTFPKAQKHPFPWKADLPHIEWDKLTASLKTDTTIAISIGLSPVKPKPGKGPDIFRRRKVCLLRDGKK